MASCRYVGPHRPRSLPGRHLDECDKPHCQGCLPCPEGHCAVCRAEHVNSAHPVTCPKCVGAVREDLSAVAVLTSHLAAHAVHANGGRVAAGPIPGGEAVVLLAPVAASMTQAQRDAEAPPADFEVGPAATAWVLGNWRADWQLLSHAPPGGPQTITASVQYLIAHLSQMAQREAAQMAAFADDVASARYHLEEVLHDGVRNEAGAPCVHCGQALVRVPADPRPCACTRHWVPHAPHRGDICCVRCRQEARHAAHVQGGLGDTWQCLRCRRRYSEQEYRYAVGVTYMTHSPRLTAAQLADKTGVAVGTIRVWGTRGLIKRAGRDEEGRTLYDVASCEARVAAVAVVP